jgi:hypothetical protein
LRIKRDPLHEASERLIRIASGPHSLKPDERLARLALCQSLPRGLEMLEQSLCFHRAYRVRDRAAVFSDDQPSR